MAKETIQEVAQEVKSVKLSAKCIKEFYDKETDNYVKVGAKLEVSTERLETLVAHGVAVQEV